MNAFNYCNSNYSSHIFISQEHDTSGWIRHVFIENMKAVGINNGMNHKSAKTRCGIEEIEITKIKVSILHYFYGVSANRNPACNYAKLRGKMLFNTNSWQL